MRSTGDVGRGEGKLQPEFCCSARDKARGFGLGEHRERKRSVVSLPGFLASMTSGLGRGACWNWGMGYSQRCGEGGWEGIFCGIHRRWGQ